MKNEILLALFSKMIEEKFAELPSMSRGPRGFKGQRGFAGQDGKDFVWADYEPQVRQWIEDAALKFEDLSASQISALRGPKGNDGRDGKDGHSFVFGEHEEKITELIRDRLDTISDRLKLKFEDLDETEIAALRGPKGRDGRDGKNFVFDEHKEYFDSLKPKFSDFTNEEKASLALKFRDLTDAEKSELKLKFSDLTEDDRFTLKGPRGFKGQRGVAGRDGEKGERGESGLQGRQGPRGLPGSAGPVGRAGRDGEAGADAPFVSDIRLEQRKTEIYFVFEFSDGTEIETNVATLPMGDTIFYGPSLIAAGGGSGGGTGTDGKSAYEIAVDNGFVGTELEWLTSLIGADGADGAPGTDGTDGTDGVDGKSAYELALDNGFVGTEAEWLTSLIGPEGPPGGTADGDSGVLHQVPCDADVYEGAAVYLIRVGQFEPPMSHWTNLRGLFVMAYFEYASRLAKNGMADQLETSNIIGIVESKQSPTLCTIRIDDVSAPLYFGLDVTDEYYLSDEVPGGMVPSLMMPTTAGHILLRLGQPLDENRFVFVRGERTTVGDFYQGDTP